ncbi:MAG: transposase family protein [Rhodothermales bacterium]
MKNLVLATEAKRIVFLSETVEGSASEKKMADEAAFCFGPEGSALRVLLVDLGFPAYQAQGARVVRPHKKPRGGELTSEQKQENQEKARERVVVEHALSGVKLWRVVKEVFRSWLHQMRDRVMYLACGLHNFRLGCRLRPIQP